MIDPLTDFLTDTSSIVLRASRADSTTPAGASQVNGVGVVWPLNVRVKVPPVAFVTAMR